MFSMINADSAKFDKLIASVSIICYTGSDRNERPYVGGGVPGSCEAVLMEK